MESNKEIVQEHDKTVGNVHKLIQKDTIDPSPQASPQGESKSAGESATNDITEHPAKAYDQTKQGVSQAYEKTTQVATDTYKQALSYGKQNPGMLTLIAFGAGIGIGVLLSGSFSSRSRSSNLIEPVGKALTQIALEIFR